jgi:hypothetical protein
MPETLNPIEPWSISSSAEIPSRMLWLADAYAEGALVLCNAIVNNEYQRQHTNTRVILNLCRHATELFFKGAIAHRTKKPPARTHRIDTLYAEYCRHYPGEKFALELPFPKEILNPEQGLFPETLEEYIQTHDQRFRYPVDSGGKVFLETLPFDVSAYAEAIDRFRSSLNYAVARIDFGWKH